MKTLLDRYYLVIMRGFESLQDRFLYFHIAGLMAMSFAINIVSLCLLFSLYVHSLWFWVVFSVIVITLMEIIDRIYNKRRRDELREKYEDEEIKSRRQGVAWVVIYEVGSLILFFLSIINCEIV
jgi:magnesium-transporting ATPase (P-type)